MRRHRFFAVVLAIFAVSVTAFSWNGFMKAKRGIVEKSFSVSAFKNISVSGACDVKFVQGPQTSVVLKGGSEIIGITEVTVTNGTLVIRQKTKNGKSYRRNIKIGLEAYVTSPNINDVSISGSGDFSSEGHIDTDVLKVKVSGSGDVCCSDVRCNSFGSSVSGSGDVKIGLLIAKNASYVVSGSGDVNVKENGVSETSVMVSGKSDIKLHGIGCGRISGNVSGSGDVKLSGTFTPIDVKTSGASMLHYNK